MVVELLKKIPGFTVEMFPWTKAQRGLYVEFERIQKAAGVRLDCHGRHSGDCTEACSYYSFHDLRRGFATVTGKSLDSRRLQKMMRHKNFSTTQRYVDMRCQMDGVTELLQVPKTINSGSLEVAKSS